MKFSVIEGWGTLPDGWSYREVAGVAVDSQDRAFVFNRGEHPIIVLDRDGRFVRSWGEGVIRRAHGITIDADDMVWLTDDLHHTVRKFTPEGKHLLTIGNPDSPAALHGGRPFNRPTHVAICPRTGYLFISDGYGNSRVHKYSPDGRHVMSWGEPGTDPGQFNLPHNLVTDRDGLVYVADRENHRVQIFDGEGRYQGQWNNLHRPCGLFADRAHDLYFVGELGSGMPVNEKTPNLGPRVTVLDGKGQRVARFGGQFPSEKPGEFIAPHGLVVDSRGDVYVGEVSWTGYGQFLTPPRVMRSFQKFRRLG
ncbi:MAG TPA: peptidyl-alpha-hydroxyglycine alpha-amidating lyase family protein [Methylomirabilota bacterium]|nr:peptidyl-alpha-hydroxyglycine alpha-amidating lyase family protein [Methylomirabilota bacterium]